MPLSHAYSAVAVVDGHANETISAAWNYKTQKEADAVALQDCRDSAKSNNMANLASKCGIRLRQKGPGAGAIVCGNDGCSYVTGYEDKQSAIDAAHDICARTYKNCQVTNITNWWDEAGYTKVLSKPMGNKCSPPAGKPVRSTTQCQNGNCTRTFENGCKVQFQAPYCRDPFSGKWEWKPDGCN